MASFDDDELSRIREYIKLREKASNSLKDYAEMVRELNNTKANAAHFEKELNKHSNEAKEISKEQLAIEAKINALKGSNLPKDQQKIKDLKEQNKQLGEQYKRSSKLARVAENQLESAQELTEALEENLTLSNGMWGAFGSLKGVMGGVVSLAKKHSSHLFEQQKGAKLAAFHMGLLSNSADSLKGSLYDAALQSNAIGVNTADLAKMQSEYSQSVGRAVKFTKAGNIAMAELAQGTSMSMDSAAIFAARMENFGLNIHDTNKFMEDTLNITASLGLNTAAVTKGLEEGLELSKDYKFKDGISGLREMVQLATKYKLEMKSISGLADKAFEPEGAIELASQLSVLGGTWSNMADPFSLMFKARTDIKGLTQDVAKAAAGTAQFNTETGEFDIASANLHRLQKVADATGISITELTDSAREAAKFKEIRSQVIGNFDEDIMKFIENTSQMSKSGEATITLNGDKYFVNELHRFTNEQLKAIAKEKGTLNDRAEEVQTFNEKWDNFINQLKATVLPGFEVFTETAMKGLRNFTDYLEKNNILEQIAKFGKFVGELGGYMLELAIDNPKITALTLLMGKAAEWIFRGRMLAVGFNMGAGKGGMLGNLFGKGGKGGGNPFYQGSKGALRAPAGGTTYNGKFYKGGQIMRQGIPGKGLTRLGGMGIGAGIGLAGGALDMYNQSRDNPHDETGQNLNVGAKALEFAGMGAMIGSMIAPGIGTAIGGVLGGLGGAAYGAYQNSKVHQDFVARPGQKPISFSSADTLIGMKKGGGIDNFITKQEKKGGSGGSVSVNFPRPLRVEGKITLNAPGGGSVGINLDDPALIRELSTLVQQQLTVAMNGKKSNSPVS